jgi:hypothetical protein
LNDTDSEKEVVNDRMRRNEKEVVWSEKSKRALLVL